MSSDLRTAAFNERDARRWVRLARRGAFEEAWRISDRIQRRTGTFGDPSLPRHQQAVWNGTPVHGRHVLVRCYHGLGDTIQFARYLPGLRRCAASVTVWAQRRLLPVLRTIDADIEWRALHDGAAPIVPEVDVEIMELAHVFRTTLDTIPREVPYLRVAPVVWPISERLRVGLAWRAGSWDTQRSIAFSSLAPLLADDHVEWLSLQFEARPDERHPRVRRLASMTITSIARAMQAVDLVVTVDSMPAHLAGALGVPTWTLLPANPDWRWLDQRTDSPWYPSMRLFRQRDGTGWSGTLAEVRQALTSTTSSGGRCAMPPLAWPPPIQGVCPATSDIHQRPRGKRGPTSDARLAAVRRGRF
jgi:hypothetical protein